MQAKIKFKTIFFVALQLLVYSKELIAQNYSLSDQISFFSQFNFNYQNINPAYSGIEGLTRFSFLHRSQWLGNQSSNPADANIGIHTQTLHFNTPLPALKGGIGGSIVNDVIGPVNTIILKGTYSYHFQVSDYTVGFGAGLGFLSQSVNSSMWRTTVSIDKDPVYQRLNQLSTSLVPELQLGVWLNHANGFLGISSSQMLATVLKPESLPSTQIKPVLNFVGGYFFKDNENYFKIAPVGVLKTNFSSLSFDVGGLIYFKEDKFWLGSTYRLNDAITACLGLSILNNTLKFGYSIDFSIFTPNPKALTSHEIMLSYSLLSNYASKLTPIKTPRFVF